MSVPTTSALLAWKLISPGKPAAGSTETRPEPEIVPPLRVVARRLETLMFVPFATTEADIPRSWRPAARFE